MKKIITGLFLATATLVLSGCGAKDTTTTAIPMQKEAQNNPTTQTINTTVMPTDGTGDLPAPPAPTGKADDTVNAIIDGANNEKTQATSDEADAKAAVDSSTDTNNLTNTYDQNNL